MGRRPYPYGSLYSRNTGSRTDIHMLSHSGLFPTKRNLSEGMKHNCTPCSYIAIGTSPQPSCKRPYQSTTSRLQRKRQPLSYSLYFHRCVPRIIKHYANPSQETQIHRNQTPTNEKRPNTNNPPTLSYLSNQLQPPVPSRN